jgi:hypothetical protein
MRSARNSCTAISAGRVTVVVGGLAAPPFLVYIPRLIFCGNDIPMGFRFFRRVQVIPGVRLNLSKSGVSASIGGRGAWFTLGPKGTRSTVGLPGTGLYYTQANSWKARSNRNNNSGRNGPPSLPIPAERVNPERAADALATLIRLGVSYETRRAAAYTFLSYMNGSEGTGEAEHALGIIFQQKYPNRDINAAMNEFSAFLQTNIAPEIDAAAEAARKANRLPWARIIVALGIGLFLLETCGDNHHLVQQSSIAPAAPASASIDSSTATVVADYCSAHPSAPSCQSETTSAPVTGVHTPESDPHPAPDFQPGPHAAAIVADYCAAHPGAPSCWGGSLVLPTVNPASCANLRTMVFGTPEEAAQARATCASNSPQGIPFTARHREFRAQAAAFGPQTHHGRN